MEIQEDLAMPVVALTLLFTFVTAIFVSRKYSRWFPREAISPTSSGQQRSTDFTLSQTSAYEVSNNLEIPEGWFTDPKVFSLERRAIFATTWLCITHISHFRRPGDYLTFNISDYPFFLILGKDSKLRGFHNVCRHRAYTVTRKPVGSSLILGCRYHGWSYDTKGKLTKAPKFDDIPGFNKEENNLYQIWVTTDDNGFIFVNFQGDWSVQDPDTKGLAAFARSSKISPASSMVAFWQAEGDFNWKLASSLFEASNGHPFVGYEPQASLPTRIFGVGNKQQATCQPSSVSALRSIPGTNLWFMTVVEPLSATRSSIRRTLYSTQPESTPTVNQKLIDDVHNDFKADLQMLNQRQFDMTHAVNTMTPSQTRLLEQIEAHMKQERKAGTQIFPAAQPVPDKDGNTSAGGVAERLCRELDSLADAGMACLKSGSDSTRLAW